MDQRLRALEREGDEGAQRAKCRSGDHLPPVLAGVGSSLRVECPACETILGRVRLEHASLVLWCEFQLAAELFDQSVCTGRNDRGVAIPRGPERSVITRHARTLRTRLSFAEVAHGIPIEVSRSARRFSERIQGSGPGIDRLRKFLERGPFRMDLTSRDPLPPATPAMEW